MIDKELGKEYSLEEREQFLSNTCDGTEEVSYSRVFTPEELAKQRELLTDASIKLADIDEAKKEAMATNILNLAMNRRSSESRAKRLAA